MAPKTGTIAKRLIITTLMLLLHFAAPAQYYPAPKPVNPEKENHLLTLLKKSKADIHRTHLLLSLANININKPLRETIDLDRAMNFAEAARELSAKLRDTSGYNNAQLYLAEVFTLRNDMKSAENILHLLNDTSKIDLLLNLSFKYWLREKPKKEDDWKKALLLAEQARQLSIRYHLPAKEILALKDIAMVHADQGKSSAEPELLKVVERYKAIGYPHLHYTYYQLAELNWVRGNPEKALNYITQTINTMKATGDNSAAGDFYVMRGNISINEEDYQKGAYFYNIAVDSYKIHAGRSSLADRRVFGLVPRALRKLKRYAEALRYVRAAMKDYPPITTTDEITYDSIIGNIYRDMKVYDKAGTYFLRTLQLSKKQNGMEDMTAYNDIGQLYVESGQYAKAKPYLDMVWKTIGNQMTSAAKSHLNYMLYLADSAAGDYRAAMNHLADYRGLEEFNLRQAQNKEVKRLEVQYDVKEKENALKIKDQHIALLNQNYKLQEIKVKQSKLEKNITIGAILVLLIFTGLLYKQYRNKQHTNRVITKKSAEILHKNEVISQKNRYLERLLHEKEWLIKEVHHRVKNNLQTIINLLESQAAYLENDALRAIETSQNRIYAMSLIHQKLYQVEHIQTINMAGYIPELILYLKDSFDNSERIDFHLEIDSLNLDASIAIPIALIINEALTNAIKYAFPDDQPGEIAISLHEQGETLKLVLADNGIGMDKGAIEANTSSLGLQLINGLTKEIHGDISIESSPGVKITIWFKKYPLEYASLLQTNGEASA
ncbi:histidine kinase dimerization/phosphoacceptor domain -containing protein [Mucilaginibacter sp.]|uniref:histidine kinase dimerization/phosphoacceptor domain -containing protein n=1 Tax=Mucilaginibacter sp. TaxID=1882438 RepID=UPI0025DAA7F3|nr:histidine kinase dimerization/phosphoacceptor domain -containing protein [Mucilaginibacter sp.]